MMRGCFDSVSFSLSYKNFVQSIVGKDIASREEVRSSLHTRELRHKAAGTSIDNQVSGLVGSIVQILGRE